MKNKYNMQIVDIRHYDKCTKYVPKKSNKRNCRRDGLG